MIGLTPYDDNQVINDYKAQFGVTNPCAGFEGNSGEAIAKIIDGQQFFGYPTYCVVCPDKKLHFNICSPPDTDCFDEFIFSCGSTSTDEIEADTEGFQVYPNPATNNITVILDGANYSNIELYNAIGEKVKSLNRTTGMNSLSFSVSELPTGIYFLRIGDKNNQVTRKISIK